LTSAAARGGGVRAVGGSLTVDGSTIGVNQLTGSGSQGGGIAAEADAALTITGSTISGNQITGPDSFGAGLYATQSATVDISSSTISGNQLTAANGRGAGIAAGTGAMMTVTGSTISGNFGAGFGATGGGVFTGGWSVLITNSTLSGNTAFIGAGVHRAAGTVSITASTIASNAGGWVVTGGPPITLKGTIIGPGGTNACGSGVPTSGGYNRAFGTTCALAGTGDQQNVDALLGPLQNNGGPTVTHLPGVGSPARDVIPAGTAGLCDGTLPTDQRGVARPQGTHCDIGSVEQ
jgi:hypothetical protein